MTLFRIGTIEAQPGFRLRRGDEVAPVSDGGWVHQFD
jgi:hypothetical protein